eukprot:sb/3471313/
MLYLSEHWPDPSDPTSSHFPQISRGLLKPHPKPHLSPQTKPHYSGGLLKTHPKPHPNLTTQEDYSNLMRSEEKLASELRDVKGRLEKLKILYSLLQSEDNENEDPEELVARLKYKRGEVEALLRDRTDMRTQIVSLQKMLNLRGSEDQEGDSNRDVNSGGEILGGDGGSARIFCEIFAAESGLSQT